MHPALGSAGGLSGGGVSGLTSGIVGALGSGGLVGPMGSPLGVVGAYSGADALCLPYRYRSCTALHNALSLAPANTVGELWGASSLIMRATLATQGAARRLCPLGYVDLSASDIYGSEWDQSGSLDYSWPAIDGATPGRFDDVPGLALDMNGSVYNAGLARFLLTRMSLVAYTAPLTFSGLPAASIPQIWSGFWRTSAGVDAGLVAWGAQGTLASATWQRAQYQTDPDSPSLFGSPTGAMVAPSVLALTLGGFAWGVASPAGRALFGGGWRPPTGGADTQPAVNATMGSAGNGFAICFGALPGDVAGPGVVVITGFEMVGDLAAA